MLKMTIKTVFRVAQNISYKSNQKKNEFSLIYFFTTTLNKKKFSNFKITFSKFGRNDRNYISTLQYDGLAIR